MINMDYNCIKTEYQECPSFTFLQLRLILLQENVPIEFKDPLNTEFNGKQKMYFLLLLLILTLYRLLLLGCPLSNKMCGDWTRIVRYKPLRVKCHTCPGRVQYHLYVRLGVGPLIFFLLGRDCVTLRREPRIRRLDT